MEVSGLVNIRQESLEYLFRERFKYEVPYFQREYSWAKDHWTDLTEDIRKCSQNKQIHFFGFMTFMCSEGDTDMLQIIEGQQRLTTISIILAAIRDIFYTLGFDEWKTLDAFIRTRDPLEPTEPISHRLTLSEVNRDFFRTFIQEEGDPEEKSRRLENKTPLDPSNKAIQDCYKFFLEQFRGDISDLAKDRAAERLLRIVKTFMRNFKIITTEVRDAESAFNIFQTLNDRGLDLTITDLIKVYLLGKVGENWKDAKSGWDDMRQFLGGQDANAFFRHYWLSGEGVVKEKDLLSSIELKVKTRSEVFEFLQRLREEAETYEALLNPGRGYWDKKAKEIVTLLSELHTLSKQQPMPLLMAASDSSRFPTNEFVKLIRICINFIFRYLTIAERENKELERLFSEIAIQIRCGKIKHTGEIKAKFAGYVDDDTFRELFAKKQVKSAGMARYVLKKIEEHLDSERETVARTLTLEHILPLSPDDEWKRFLLERNIEKDQWVHRIGNLTLLTEKPNRTAKNRSFQFKKETVYTKSTKLKINRSLADADEWTPEAITTRQMWMAKKAVHIWSL